MGVYSKQIFKQAGKMHFLTLTVTSCLIFSTFGFNIKIDEDERSERSLIQPQGNSRLFAASWCDLYQKNCLDGCAKSVCNTGAKCIVSGMFYRCEWQCSDITTTCVNSSGDAGSSGSTTPTTTTTTTTPLTCPSDQMVSNGACKCIIPDQVIDNDQCSCPDTSKEENGACKC